MYVTDEWNNMFESNGEKQQKKLNNNFENSNDLIRKALKINFKTNTCEMTKKHSSFTNKNEYNNKVQEKKNT